MYSLSKILYIRSEWMNEWMNEILTEWNEMDFDLIYDLRFIYEINKSVYYGSFWSIAVGLFWYDKQKSRRSPSIGYPEFLTPTSLQEYITLPSVSCIKDKYMLHLIN